MSEASTKLKSMGNFRKAINVDFGGQTRAVPVAVFSVRKAGVSQREEAMRCEQSMHQVELNMHFSKTNAS